MTQAVANDLISLAYFTFGSQAVPVDWRSAAGGQTVSVLAGRFLLTVSGTDELFLGVQRRNTNFNQTVYGWYAIVSSTAAFTPDQAFFGDSETTGYGNRDLGVRLQGDSSALSGDVVIKSSFVDMAVFPAASP